MSKLYIRSSLTYEDGDNGDNKDGAPRLCGLCCGGGGGGRLAIRHHRQAGGGGGAGDEPGGTATGDHQYHVVTA